MWDEFKKQNSKINNSKTFCDKQEEGGKILTFKKHI